MTQTQKIFKWVTLVFFTVLLFTLTIGRETPLEFSNKTVMRLFYNVLLLGLPIATLLTYVWTFNKEKAFRRNLGVGLLTGLLTCLALFVMVILMWVYAYGGWVNEEIIYESKLNPNVTINRQLRDEGGFGYGVPRTVKLTPVLYLWNWVEEVDTTEMNRRDWVLVQREGDLKCP